MANRWGNSGRLYFGGAPKSLQMVTTVMNLKDAPWKKSYDKPRQHIKKQRHYFANKGLSRQSYGFSSSHVWMWELDYKKSWAPKNWCFWTVVLEKTLESPLDCKEIKLVNPKGNQSWIFIRRTDGDWNSNTLATWREEWAHWKRPWFWERFKAGGEGEDRGWVGLMASPTGWTWVWVGTRSWRWTGKPGSYRPWFCSVGHDWATEQNRQNRRFGHCMSSQLFWLWVNILSQQTLNKFCTFKPIHWATKIQMPKLLIQSLSISRVFSPPALACLIQPLNFEDL